MMSPKFSTSMPAPATRRARPRRRRVAGFTLLEAMLSTTIFTMVTLGVYTILIKSYQMIALSRCRDEALAVLRTYADQFLRLQTTERVGGATYNRWLFNPTHGPSGRGLQWGELSDANTSTAAAEVPNIAINLGSGGHATPATLTRDVRYVASTDGANVNSLTIDAAGFLLSATFAISYRSSGKDYTQSVTVTRATP
jgi:Tfp pilus assembly protein PilV